MRGISALLSGYPDSNGGPPAPKAGALANCATSRKIKVCLNANPLKQTGGEGGGIRTPDTVRAPSEVPAVSKSTFFKPLGAPVLLERRKDMKK